MIKVGKLYKFMTALIPFLKQAGYETTNLYNLPTFIEFANETNLCRYTIVVVVSEFIYMSCIVENDLDYKLIPFNRKTIGIHFYKDNKETLLLSLRTGRDGEEKGLGLIQLESIHIPNYVKDDANF